MASYEYLWLGLIKGLFWKYDGDGWTDGLRAVYDVEQLGGLLLLY